MKILRLQVDFYEASHFINQGIKAVMLKKQGMPNRQ